MLFFERTRIKMKTEKLTTVVDSGCRSFSVDSKLS